MRTRSVAMDRWRCAPAGRQIIALCDAAILAPLQLQGAAMKQGCRMPVLVTEKALIELLSRG